MEKRHGVLIGRHLRGGFGIHKPVVARRAGVGGKTARLHRTRFPARALDAVDKDDAFVRAVLDVTPRYAKAHAGAQLDEYIVRERFRHFDGVVDAVDGVLIGGNVDRCNAVGIDSRHNFLLLLIFFSLCSDRGRANGDSPLPFLLSRPAKVRRRGRLPFPLPRLF